MSLHLWSLITLDKGKTKWNRYQEILASKDIKKKNYNLKNNVERKR